MNVVIDASAVIQIVLRPELVDRFALLRKKTDHFIAPDIFLAEVGNAIWKYHRFSNLEVPLCWELAETLSEMVDTLIPIQLLYKKALEITITHSMTMYDSLYLVCALQVSGRLLTLDQKMVKGAETLGLSTLSI
jgi:predicted nucleic acid-binding protein